MKADEIKEALLTDAQRLLDNAESLIDRCNQLEQRNKELEQLVNAGGSNGTASWIEFDEKDDNSRPHDGELVVVQVANCPPFMLTYLKGCKVAINKWFRLPE